MGTSTNTIATVTAAQIAADARTLLIEPRETLLRHRAPKDDRVHTSRRKIKSGAATPFEMVLTQSITDILDGVPVEVAVRPYEAIVASLKAMADAARDDVLLPMVPANLREQRAGLALDEVQMRLIDDPENPDLAALLLERSAAYRAELTRLEKAAERVVTQRIAPVPHLRAS